MVTPLSKCWLSFLSVASLTKPSMRMGWPGCSSWTGPWCWTLPLVNPRMPSSPSKCHASWEHGSQVTRTENKTQVRIVILYPQFFRSLRLLTLGSIYWTVAVSWRISWWPVDRTAWNTHSPLHRPSFLARHDLWETIEISNFWCKTSKICFVG